MKDTTMTRFSLEIHHMIWRNARHSQDMMRYWILPEYTKNRYYWTNEYKKEIIVLYGKIFPQMSTEEIENRYIERCEPKRLATISKLDENYTTEKNNVTKAFKEYNDCRLSQNLPPLISLESSAFEDYRRKPEFI